MSDGRSRGLLTTSPSCSLLFGEFFIISKEAAELIVEAEVGTALSNSVACLLWCVEGAVEMVSLVDDAASSLGQEGCGWKVIESVLKVGSLGATIQV